MDRFLLMIAFCFSYKYRYRNRFIELLAKILMPDDPIQLSGLTTVLGYMTFQVKQRSKLEITIGTSHKLQITYYVTFTEK